MAVRTLDNRNEWSSERASQMSMGGEMHDLSNQPLNNDPGDQRSLERADRMSLVPQESADHRAELYARLRTIIDNATESIRALKEENAALKEENAERANQVGTLEHRIQAVTEGLANDERALRQSVEALERVMHGTPTATGSASTPPASDAASPPTVTDTMPVADVPSPPPLMTEPEAAAEPEEQAAPEMEEKTEGHAIPASMEETGPITAPDMPTPIARDEHERERVVAPRLGNNPDGTYTLIASPFIRFSDLGQFQAALQKLTGVHNAQVRRFAQGTLEMRIGYSGTTDLATTLRTLATEIEDVSEEEPYQLRVRLRTSQDA